MKKGALFVFVVFLMVFMVGSVFGLNGLNHEYLDITDLQKEGNCLYITAKGNVDGDNITLGLHPCFWVFQIVDGSSGNNLIHSEIVSMNLQVEGHSWLINQGIPNAFTECWECETIDEIVSESSTSFNPVFLGFGTDNEEIFTGSIILDLRESSYNGKGSVLISGFFIDIEDQQSNYEERISALELWKETIEDWKDSLMDTISDILLTLTGLTTSIDDHEDRITIVETTGGSGGGGSGNQTGAGTWENYKKYIDKRTIEDMLCGYAKDREMKSIFDMDLGYKCDLDYTESSRGTRVRCSCVEIDENNFGYVDMPFYLSSWQASSRYVKLKIENNNGEDYFIEDVEVTNCGIEEVNDEIDDGRYEYIRIYCDLERGELFEGDITINYKEIGSEEVLQSIGEVVTFV